MWSTKSRMNLWIYDWSVKPILNSTSAFWPNKTEPEDWCWSSSCHLRPETIAHSSTSSLRRLPLSRIPSATNGIPSKCAGNGISGKLEPAAFRSNSSQDNHWWDRYPRIWTISCHMANFSALEASEFFSVSVAFEAAIIDSPHKTQYLARFRVRL